MQVLSKHVTNDWFNIQSSLRYECAYLMLWQSIQDSLKCLLISYRAEYIAVKQNGHGSENNCFERAYNSWKHSKQLNLQSEIRMPYFSYFLSKCFFSFRILGLWLAESDSVTRIPVSDWSNSECSRSRRWVTGRSTSPWSTGQRMSSRAAGSSGTRATTRRAPRYAGL